MIQTKPNNVIETSLCIDKRRGGKKGGKLTLFHLPLGWCLFKNGNRKLLPTIPIPLELTTLKLARSEIINMAI